MTKHIPNLNGLELKYETTVYDAVAELNRRPERFAVLVDSKFYCHMQRVDAMKMIFGLFDDYLTKDQREFVSFALSEKLKIENGITGKPNEAR